MTKKLPSLLIALFLLFPIHAWAQSYVLYAGSYTAGTSKGIYAWRFNARNGALKPLGLMAQTQQPAHIWIAPNGETLYTVNWLNDGTVSAYHINRKTGALVFLNSVSSHGAQPNQVVVDPTGHIAVTVNYTTGTMAAFKLEPDGKLGEAFYVDHHSGKPLSPKQPGPKAHGIQFSKDGRWLYVAELGLDRVYSYRVDPLEATITPFDPPFVSTHAGAGPRRLQLSPNGRYLYVNHETDSQVSVFQVHGGQLTEIQTIATVPDGAQAHNTTAEINISADGRFLYVSNRGHDSIAIYAINPKTGKLRIIAYTPSGGRTPRNIRIDPTGQYLFAANENGGNITEFKIDRQTGQITPTGVSVPIDTPGGLYFLKTN